MPGLFVSTACLFRPRARSSSLQCPFVEGGLRFLRALPNRLAIRTDLTKGAPARGA
jgi:hypothetical protein